MDQHEAQRSAGFAEFVASRTPALSRTAYLLTGDHHLAEDLLQTALLQAARHWERIEAAPEAYAKGTLAEDMVLTVEPGLYFQEDDLLVPEELRGIGIRIEDDILVTADGYRNLSDSLPRTSAGVEEWMAAQQR